MGIKVRWSKWNGAEISKKVKQNIKEASKDTAETVLQKSKGEVPLDEGILMRSGGIKQTTSGSSIITDIYYGGGKGTGFPIVPYALRWHEENANFQHGRKSKYLIDPFNQLARNTMLRSLRVKMRGL